MTTYVNATSLPRLMNCGGSLYLDRSSDEMPSEDIIEGNAAHRVIQEVFTKGFNPFQMIGQKVNNNFIVTDEMVDFLAPIIARVAARNLPIATEHNTDWTIIRDRYAVNGRCDWSQYDAVTRTLYIDDLKYGWRIVSPENNWTLISHAVAVNERNRGAIIERIVFTIHQPRPFHPEGKSREWIISIDELANRWTDIFNRFDTLDNTLVTGPHCYQCAGLYPCPAARQAGLNAIDVSISGYSETLDGVELGQEIIMLERAADMIKQRKNALESLALDRLKKGEPVSGFALERGLGKTRWLETATPDVLEALTGKNLTDPKLVTPAEAKRRGVPESIVDNWSHRPFTGFQIVREDLDKKAKKLLGKK